MNAFSWPFLLVMVVAGGFVLARPDRFSFRGSVLFGFLLLSLGMTSPLVLQMKRMMLASGAGPDAFIGVWDLWWVRTALALGRDPLQTGWLFHPNGTSLALHTNAFAYGAAALPFTLPGTPGPERLFVVYNLLLIASFTLTGYFTYRLALLETGHRPAALLAGIVFAYSNYRFANTVRLHVIATEFLVLAAWGWVALLRHPSPRRLVLWAGAMVLLAYASLEYAAYSGLLLIVLAIPGIAGLRSRAALPSIAALRSTGAARLRSWMIAAAACAAGGIVLLLPLLVQLAARLREGGTGFDPRLVSFFSADLFDLFLPNPRHPFWGRLFAALTASWHAGDPGFGLSLGWIAIALFAGGSAVLLRERRQRVWLWGFLFFAVLSLGPVLHAGGRPLGVPLPQALLSRVLPFLSGSRTPIRYMAPAGLCFAVALAAGWAALRRARGFTDEKKPLRAEILIGALLLFEMLAAPLPMLSVPVPAYAAAIATSGAAPGAYALIEVPGVPARQELLAQTKHRQRLIADVSSAIPLRSRRGADPFASPEWIALTRQFAVPTGGMPEADRVRMAAAVRAFLRRTSVRWVVVVRALDLPDPDGLTIVKKPVLTEAETAAFRENLRLLQPRSEREVGDGVVFEFDAAPIGVAASR